MLLPDPKPILDFQSIDLPVGGPMLLAAVSKAGMFYLVATQFKNKDDHSYSKVSE
jgi:hypothetical protein